MKATWIVIAGVILLLLIFGVKFVSTRNEIVTQKEAITASWAQVDTFRNFTNNVPLQLIVPTEQLMADNTVQPRGELLGHWTFGSMDQAVHLRPGWGFALSRSSGNSTR